jgi:SAM-dependent methyltransferase
MIWTEESIAFLRDAAAMSDYYRVIAGKIAPHLPENAHVCDAGCGIGELSIALAPYCRHVTAVDADELAVKTLESHRPERVAARCGDIEALAPDKPYDAMVFCLFGRTEDALGIAGRQCRGKIFLVKRDYSHHRFSAGKISLGEYTAGNTESVLRERGIPYTLERFSAEFGQPFRSIEEAERFFALYNRSESETLSAREIEARLTAGPSEEFPYYLPHQKALCLFTIETADLPKEKTT